MLETKFGIPWIKVNFIGANSAAKALRKIAAYFEDQKLIDRVEEVIREEMLEVEKVVADVSSRTKGKTTMIFVGGSRSHHYLELFKELKMEVLSAGYEFGHRDDYEGRRILPGLKIDADSRNIEELKVEADETRYSPRKTKSQLEALEKSGVKFKHYEGMAPDLKEEALIFDDVNQYEVDKLVELLKPDLFCAGIKERFSVMKLGIPMKQLHSYDSGGPYAGFRGAVNFYKEIDRLLSSDVWKHLKAPWQENPELTGAYVWE
jgi:nitrogenase molybdenum-iron protein alpha chain